jgi:hypothetical protein
MKLAGSYSVAKFVPDRVRFEPVNIGLVIEAGDRVITRMTEKADPRIRLSDPFADIPSLEHFLKDFDAVTFGEQSGAQSVIEWLHENGLPNIYFSAPSPIAIGEVQLEALVDRLFQRLIARRFTKPPDWTGSQTHGAARTALGSAFRSAKVLGNKVQSRVSAPGASGVIWDIDFRYLTDMDVNFVQTATTSVREDMRRKEHAYEAFAALIDTTVQHEATVGVLAVDDPPTDNPVSFTLEMMAKGHGLRFIAGQRSFHEYAGEVRRRALPVRKDGETGRLEQLLMATAPSISSGPPDRPRLLNEGPTKPKDAS